jgi:hypothetical protein
VDEVIGLPPLLGEGVGEGVGEGALVDFSSDGSCLSGITSFATSSAHNVHARAVRQMPVQRVHLRSPSSLLHEAGAPAVIDYLSLDVEGGEMHVLQHWPFDRHCVRFMSVETNNNRAKEEELRLFLQSHGYQFAGHAGVDDFFANDCGSALV